MGAARLQCRARSMRKCCRQSNAETRDRAGDLQIFSLTLSQLSYRGSCTQATSPVTWTWASLSRSLPPRSQENQARPPRASSGHGASKIIPPKTPNSPETIKVVQWCSFSFVRFQMDLLGLAVVSGWPECARNATGEP